MFATVRREHLPLHLFNFGFWLFALQIGRLSGYVYCPANFNSWAFQVTHIFCHLCTRFCTTQNFFYAFSQLFVFHIAKLVFNLTCLHFVFKPQSDVISYCALTFYPFRLLSIYLFIFYLTGRSLITEFIFWWIYPV